MKTNRKPQNLDSVSDWELGLLFELRLLDDAGLLGPVVNIVADALEALYEEAERRGHQTKPNQRKNIARQLISENTISGRLSQPSKFMSSEIERERFVELARKSRLAAVNRCRRYVGSTI